MNKQIKFSVSCNVRRSFRVEQVVGMFDLKLAEKLGETFAVDLPPQDGDWRIGAIVGPSGSGKSTLARRLFGDALQGPADWPADAAVIDGFPAEASVKDITKTLSGVGLSSPPSWVKPYAVLSNGERFRCDLARALLTGGDLVVYDEFTSVVDRTVGKIASAAIAKAVRKDRTTRQFVAVTCHYDVLEWLEPDWVLDMASGQLARGSLRRPPIRLEIAPVHTSAWVLFRRHHYLSGNILAGAKCFAAFWGDRPVGFSAWTHYVTQKRRPGDMREHRTVVLPDFQGVGIGNRLSEFCASLWCGLGGRAFSSTSHPSMIHYRSASPLWRRIRLSMVSPMGKSGLYGGMSHYPGNSCRRITAGFRYVGSALDAYEAQRLMSVVPRRF